MKKNIRFYFASFLIPLVILLVAYACLGIYFGKADFLQIDLKGQYLAYFSYYQDTLWQGQNFFYSFSKGLGDGMLPLFAYYLASPLNLIILLFPKEQLVSGLLVITLIKVGLCGLSFYTFIKPKTQSNKMALVFASCYALMGYVLFYSQNIMWLDGIIWLPIICLGIERILFKNKPLVYILSLAIALASNYYIGFILCIASVLYVLYQFLFFHQSIERKVKVLLHFALASILAAMLSAFMLLPAYFSVSSKMSLEVLENRSFVYGLVDLMKKFVLGWSGKTFQLINSDPNVYCGLISLLTYLVLMIQKKISKRDKIMISAFLFLFLMSMCFSMTNMVWHGFKIPMGFRFRQSFVFSFFLLTFVASNFHKIEKLEMKHSLLLGSIFSIILVSFALIPTKYNLSWLNYGVTLLFVFIYLFIFTVQPKKYKTLLVGVVLAELFTNTALTYHTFPYSTQKEVQTYFKNNELTIIDKNQRMVIVDEYNANDPFLFNFAGLDHFSSVENKRDYNVRKYAGYHYREHMAFYELGSTLFMDSLLGVSRRVESAPSYFKDNDELIKENPDALPYLFLSSDAIKDSEIHLMNPFKFQNQLYQGISGLSEDLFIEVIPVSRSIENLKEVTDSGLHQFTKIDPEKPAYVHFVLPRDENQLYYNISTDDTNLIYYQYRLDVSVDSGIPISYLGDQFSREGIVYLNPNGTQSVSMDIELLNDYMEINKFQFYKMDQGKYDNFMTKQKVNQFEVELLNSNKLKATIKTDSTDRYVATSIIWDPNWEIVVDGKKIEYDCLADSFIGFQLENSEANVVMTYKPVQFKYGIIVSGLGIMGTALYVLLMSREVKRRKL